MLAFPTSPPVCPVPGVQVAPYDKVRRQDHLAFLRDQIVTTALSLVLRGTGDRGAASVTLRLHAAQAA